MNEPRDQRPEGRGAERRSGRTRGARTRAFALLSALGLWPAMAVDAAPAPPTSAAERAARDLDSVRRAVDFVKTHAGAAGQRFSPGLLQKAELALARGDVGILADEGPVVTVGAQKFTLQSDALRLAELGSSLRAREDRENLLRLYTLVHGRLRPGLRASLPAPTAVSTKSAPELQVQLAQMANAIAIDPPVWNPIQILLPPTAARCEAELGYEDGTDGNAGTCGAYATNGIMRNVAFPLRDDLTCVRNQGRRGTCVAFGSLGAVETAVHVMNGNFVNLSEQHAYWYGETSVGFAGRYTDGLNTSDFLAELVSSGYEIPKEKIWNYNPSLSRQAKSGDVYPDSCVGYSGEECSDYAFQSVEVPWLGSFIHPNPMPNAGAFTVTSAVSLGTDSVGLNLAKGLLDAGVPLVVALDVTSSFVSPNADGYVTYVANQVPTGGHALEVAGWVPNAELPSGAPAGAGGGYFVLRNSWGEPPGDCGYYYLPASYLEAYGRSLTSIDVQ